ncbi:DUF3040 domain-containing protein [Nakamurella multipartita]|jgi:hypothetical protein|uniref:DUF3040 domain-containing protein n=1 Tax=Nakamurella multipartita (strain ATCC 700099 / DSM 44233 / CIP 104796 / JCM 9543 / NBRC 105858 / Y-104) TaxID=479431 RepID=C8XGJ3_NAKMY|nr:DUF3040 domain-containing protein [Nakamurella multipartita]ACV78176.1 hypothetical protein Namu_1786 [Nakamurella multipartita DSM 44233]HOZ58228.1 DUF3040 domain-containing protein [Nakamurella multipartita]
MPLSPDEQVRLDEIEAHVRAADPSWSARLDGPAAERARRRGIVRCLLMLLAGTAVMVMGAAAVSGSESVGMAVAAAGVGLMVRALLMARELNPPQPGIG